jgi:hypothetical protein
MNRSFVVLAIVTFLLVGCSSSDDVLTGQATHGTYGAFSAPESGFRVSNGWATHSDDAVYKTAWYSVNGSAWQQLSLSGSAYGTSSSWLAGAAYAPLPAALFGPGEHYLIVYTCSYDQGWQCHGGWQLFIIDKAPVVPDQCGVCDIGFSCVEGVCEFSGPGELYYVATDGDDSNPGTISRPWATLQQAITMALPGDTVYLRGGVYYADGSITGDPSMGRGASGTAEAPIRFLNYPGERPIFDWSGFLPTDSRWNSAISWSNVQYLHLRGFTVRNVRQPTPDFSLEGEQYGTAAGIGCTMCANIIYENLVVHDVDGRAFQHWTGAWSDLDALYAIELGFQTEYKAPLYASETTTWINCDAYNLYDRYSKSPGNHADGWKVETYYGNHFTWEGCRAWNYSDDGFDPHGTGTRIFDRCWAMSTLHFEDLSPDWDVEGNGFKTTAAHNRVIPDYAVGETHLVFTKNSIAADCGWIGFSNNHGWIDYDYISPNGGMLYNNLAYHNIIGFSDQDASTYRNNIAYGSQGNASCGGPYDVAMFNKSYTESDNTWMLVPDSCKTWESDPAFHVTDDDFVNLDTMQLTAPRRSDGTLPDITFGHLAPGSDLIDAGMIIPGYHCATPGLHPGDDCVAWTGAAPDLGPFEYGLEQETVCRGPTARPCVSEDGIGQQKRTCIGPGEWSEFSVCEFVGCDDGYILEGGSCVIGPGWSRELLFNGGFEDGLDGWTASSSDWGTAPYTIYGTPRTPHSGYYIAYIAIRSGAEGFLYQDIDLMEYVTRIDEGRLAVNVSGWAISPMIYAAENTIKFQFLDGAKAVISTPLDTGYVRNPAWWEAKLSEEPVPAGTRYLRVWANSKDTYNMGLASGDLDSFSVKINVLDG